MATINLKLLNLSKERGNELIERLAAIGFALHKSQKRAIRAHPNDLDKNDLVSIDDVLKFFDWLDENIELIKRTKEIKDTLYFAKAASTLSHAVKIDFMDVVNRSNLGFDLHDDLIFVGKSKKAISTPDAPMWREHLVPCKMIIDEAIRMVEAGSPESRIVQMLKQNLAIMVITQDEQESLDSKYRTSMPSGWKFGDDVFARLDAVGIEY